MIPFSPESRLLHVNQVKHRQHADPILATRFKDYPRLSLLKDSNSLSQNHSSRKALKIACNREEHIAIQKTYTLLSAIAADTLNRLSQTHTDATKTSKAFILRILGVENGRVNVSLDFSKSLLKLTAIKRVIQHITDLPQHNKLFFIQKCLFDETKDIHLLLAQVKDEFMNDPRTSQATKQAVQAQGFLFTHTITKKTNPYAMVPWTLSISFANSPLNFYELQYVLWKILLMKKYLIRFDISSLDFTNTAMDINKLTDIHHPNLQYKEASSTTVACLLHLTITELYLSQCKIGRNILLPLSQFPHLHTLHLDLCTQNQRNAVKPQDILKACPRLTCLNIKKWILEEDPKEKPCPLLSCWNQEK